MDDSLDTVSFSTDGGSDSDECIPAWAAESESWSSSKPPVKDAFSALMGPRKRSGEEVEEECRIWGVLYCITLTGVPRDHPLFGILYIGQAIRCHAKTALEAAEMRWKEEVGHSKKHNKQVGLLWALEEFGESAFRFEVIDSKFAPKSELNNWADLREIELIAKHGGVLKDQNKRCKQTLNLDPGGQGSRGLARAAMWKVVRAKLIDRFKTEMEAYAKEHDSSLVPTSYVTPGGYKLGRQLHKFRQGVLRDGMPDEKEIREWAEALPKWAWDAKKTKEWREALSKRTLEQWDKPENLAAASKRALEQWDKPENLAAASKRASERLANETEKERADRLAKQKKTKRAKTDATLIGLAGKELESREKRIAKQRRADAKLADELLLYRRTVKSDATVAEMRRARSEGWKSAAPVAPEPTVA